jgi:NhaA family Na+:H+ antiporter
MKITQLYKDFFDSEKAGGLTLIICTVLSLILANSGVGASYHDFFQIQFQGHSIEHWINDGLMSIFLSLTAILHNQLIISKLCYFL